MPNSAHDVKKTGSTDLINRLTHLQAQLIEADSQEASMTLLRGEPLVKTYLKEHPGFEACIKSANPLQQSILLKIVAIGQGPQIFSDVFKQNDASSRLRSLADLLTPTEQYYTDVGGIVGYHLITLELLRGDIIGPFAKCAALKILKPHPTDIRQPTREVRESVIAAVKRWSSFAEIYVVGGAGDRLDLRDPTSGEALPAAKLEFDGHTLLTGLMRDVESREYLHYKLFGQQLTTPIAMMTSYEKNNHAHITAICEQSHWFGRPKESFRFFCQPSCPIITTKGTWALTEPYKPLLKPGGHGAIWKLGIDSGVFDWLKSLGRSKLLIRQVNNPVASTDYGLLAFLGTGLRGEKTFGVATCDRFVNMPEGMSVLIETSAGDGFDYRMTNIEYTEFERHGLKDMPANPGDVVSPYPANTNILFADISAVRAAAIKHPLPGLLINTKTAVPTIDDAGNVVRIPAGRLETMMQNIADVMSDHFSHQLSSNASEPLQTFATYYTRRKTLSTTKSSLGQSKQIAGTPEGCFYDLLANYRELLTQHCGWTLPELPSQAEMSLTELPFLVHLHPAAGPLFSIIGQKIRGGKLSQGSELYLEIAEMQLTNVKIDGSLNVIADNITGHLDEAGIRRYSKQTGKCILRNVTVSNAGVDYASSAPFWKRQIKRRESCSIRIHGNGEFFADNVQLNGSVNIDVADGERVVAWQDSKGVLQLTRSPLPCDSWHWNYTTQDGDINLKQVTNLSQ